MSINTVLNRLMAIGALGILALPLFVVLTGKSESPETKQQVIAIATDQFRPSEAFLRLGHLQDISWLYIGKCGISGETLRDDNLREVSLGVDVVDDNLRGTRRYFEFCVDKARKELIPKDAEAKEALDY